MVTTLSVAQPHTVTIHKLFRFRFWRETVKHVKMWWLTFFSRFKTTNRFKQILIKTCQRSRLHSHHMLYSSNQHYRPHEYANKDANTNAVWNLETIQPRTDYLTRINNEKFLWKRGQNDAFSMELSPFFFNGTFTIFFINFINIFKFLDTKFFCRFHFF